MNNSDCFREYPDILTIEQLMEMLHIGRNSAYSMLKEGLIKTIKVGKKYIIPKKSVIEFIETAC